MAHHLVPGTEQTPSTRRISVARHRPPRPSTSPPFKYPARVQIQEQQAGFRERLPASEHWGNRRPARWISLAMAVARRPQRHPRCLAQPPACPPRRPLSNVNRALVHKVVQQPPRSLLTLPSLARRSTHCRNIAATLVFRTIKSARGCPPR